MVKSLYYRSPKFYWRNYNNLIKKNFCLNKIIHLFCCVVWNLLMSDEIKHLKRNDSDSDDTIRNDDDKSLPDYACE